jgi:ferredoxin
MCTGHGTCESIADDVFEVRDDGLLIIEHDKRRYRTEIACDRP